MADDLALNLLLAHHDNHRPVLARALNGRAAVHTAAPKMRIDGDLAGLRTGDMGDLAEQGWGVVAPAGDEGDRLVEAVRPLIQHREQEQGRVVKVFRSVPGFAGDMPLWQGFAWRDVVIDGQRGLDDELPCYLLILGDLDRVPLAIQQALAATGNRVVGRLAFDRIDDYRAYAVKVVSLDRSQLDQSQHEHRVARALFHTVKDGTDATSQGYDMLVARIVTELGTKTSLPVRESGSPAPNPDELVAAVRASDQPALLFTLSHGEGAPKSGWPSPEAQRRYQGTMSFGRGQRLDDDVINAGPFLPGGVWVSLCCFGAGTPMNSPYLGWVAERAAATRDRSGLADVLASQPLDGRPFIAHQAKVALAHPRGPCAFIGHVDLAWTFGFSDPDDAAGSRPGHFARMARDIVAGHRVGQGMRAVHSYATEVATHLATLHTDRSGDNNTEQRAMQWLIWQDLAGYIVLGDPAVRLPIPSKPLSAAPAGQRGPAVTSAGGMARVGDRAVDVGARDCEMDAIERAIARLILREGPRAALRKERLRIGEDEFERLARVFRDAGRAALTRARDK